MLLRSKKMLPRSKKMLLLKQENVASRQENVAKFGKPPRYEAGQLASPSLERLGDTKRLLLANKEMHS